MIRQTLKPIVVLASLCAAALLTGCVSVQTGSGGRVTYWVVPGMESGDQTNRAGTTYFNQRWSASPGTHPAVAGPAQASPDAVPGADGNTVESRSGSTSSAYPPYSTRTSQEARADGQVSGAVLGALIGAQTGNRLGGIAIGSAIGALTGGRLADPCQPSPNAGSIWGTLLGGWLGSMFGGGRGREFFTALGAAGGAVRGTEYETGGRGCR